MPPSRRLPYHHPTTRPTWRHFLIAILRELINHHALLESDDLLNSQLSSTLFGERDPNSHLTTNRVRQLNENLNPDPFQFSIPRRQRFWHLFIADAWRRGDIDEAEQLRQDMQEEIGSGGGEEDFGLVVMEFETREGRVRWMVMTAERFMEYLDSAAWRWWLYGVNRGAVEELSEEFDDLLGITVGIAQQYSQNRVVDSVNNDLRARLM